MKKFVLTMTMITGFVVSAQTQVTMEHSFFTSLGYIGAFDNIIDWTENRTDWFLRTQLMILML